MPYNEGFVPDPSWYADHGWLVTIQWASKEDQMHPDLHQERTALIDDMVNTERALAPPVSIDDLTTSRKFLRFEDAEFYVEGVRALATKYNCNLVKAEITGDSGDLSHKGWG